MQKISEYEYNEAKNLDIAKAFELYNQCLATLEENVAEVVTTKHGSGTVDPIRKVGTGTATCFIIFIYLPDKLPLEEAFKLGDGALVSGNDKNLWENNYERFSFSSCL